MVTNIIENENYKKLIEKQIREIINYLLEEDQTFSITVNIEGTTFEPPLPNAIRTQLQKFSLFTLENYTYQSIKIEENIISFEAGFGSENFGSVVSVPFHCIFQIVIDESILYLNPVATVDKFNKDYKNKSMNIFKNNPKNRRFTKDD